MQQYRNTFATLLVAGAPGGRQVVIDPSIPGQISFPNPNGFTPATIGTSSSAPAETLDIIGPHWPGHAAGAQTHMRFNDNSTAPPSWSVEVDDGVSKGMSLILDTVTGLQATLGSAAVGNNFYGNIPVITNNTTFGGSGTRWLFQIVFFSGMAVTSGVSFFAGFPLTFPAGEAGAWAWPSLFSAAGGQTLCVSGMFPGGNHAGCNLIANVTGSISFGLLCIALYA